MTFFQFKFFFFLKKFIYLFIYLWLCWVFVFVRGLPLVAASGGHSSSRCAGLSLSRPLLPRSTASRRAGSAIVAHGPSRSAACGIFLDQGSNPCPLHWQADSQPLRHQRSPKTLISYLSHLNSFLVDFLPPVFFPQIHSPQCVQSNHSENFIDLHSWLKLLIVFFFLPLRINSKLLNMTFHGLCPNLQLHVSHILPLHTITLWPY